MSTTNTTVTARGPIRQGDVILIPIDADRFPANATAVPRENGRVVLAHGEVTGHAHVIDSPDVLFVQADLDEMADRFLRIESEAGVQLVHDEHSALTVPQGDWIVRRQREYSPQEIRRVAD